MRVGGPIATILRSIIFFTLALTKKMHMTETRSSSDAFSSENPSYSASHIEIRSFWVRVVTPKTHHLLARLEVEETEATFEQSLGLILLFLNFSRLGKCDCFLH